MINERKMTRVYNTKELLVGDWIILKINDEYWRGYVTRIKSLDFIDMYCIGKYYKNDYYPVNKPYKSVDIDDFISYKDKDLCIDEIEDKRHLIDLTLRTWDEDWFNELVN